jgi:hypothetical protein
MRLTRYGFAVAVSLALSFAPARADLLSEAISISGAVAPVGRPQAPSTLDTSQFVAFNPALGTLSSISVSLFGTLYYAGNGLPEDEGANLEFREEPVVSDFCGSGIVDCIDIPALGLGLPFSFTLSGLTNPTVLSNYSGTGLRAFVVEDIGGNASDLITLSGVGAVTFDYTPVSATPEPHGTAILLTLLILLLGCYRRRLWTGHSKLRILKA